MQERIQQSSTITGAVLVLATAVLAALPQFGIPLTDGQHAAILSVFTAGIGLWDMFRKEGVTHET